MSSTRRAALVRAFAGGNGRKNDDTDAHSIAVVGLHGRIWRRCTPTIDAPCCGVLSNRRRELGRATHPVWESSASLLGGGWWPEERHEALTGQEGSSVVGVGGLPRRDRPAASTPSQPELPSLSSPRWTREKVAAIETPMDPGHWCGSTPTGLPKIYGVGPVIHRAGRSVKSVTSPASPTATISPATTAPPPTTRAAPAAPRIA